MNEFDQSYPSRSFAMICKHCKIKVRNDIMVSGVYFNTPMCHDVNSAY